MKEYWTSDRMVRMFIIVAVACVAIVHVATEEIEESQYRLVSSKLIPVFLQNIDQESDNYSVEDSGKKIF